MEREPVAFEMRTDAREEVCLDGGLRQSGTGSAAGDANATRIDQTVEALVTNATLIETDFGGGNMALKDLERLTGELENLALLLRAEQRPQARWVILERVQEIMNQIGEGLK